MPEASNMQQPEGTAWRENISVSEQRGTELTLGCQVVLPQGAVVSKGLMEKGLGYGKWGGEGAGIGTKGGVTLVWPSLF